MSEGVQIYRCDNAAICKEDFFNMTKLNFEYDRRHLFTRKKNKWEYNNYFPFDLVNERLGFYGLYLSCYTDLDFASLDFDFDIGLNNLEYNFEEKLISCLKNEYSRIVIEILNSQANKSIIEKIEREYNILFSSVGIYNIYVISFSNIEEISFIQKYILCILLD